MPPSSILNKSMALLDLVAASQTPLTLGDVALKSGLPKSSAHRLLVLLREAQALSYDPEHQTYVPGSRLMRWGVQTLQNDTLATIAAPHMRMLCQDTGMRVALSMMDGNSVLYLHTTETGSPFRLAPRIGQHSPLHASAAGKLFLASLAEKDLRTRLETYDLEKCTEFTITDRQGLLEEVSKVQRNGFAVSAREEFRQTSGLAVPILSKGKTSVAALSIWNVGDADLLVELKAHIERLQQAAADIQKGYGHTA